MTRSRLRRFRTLAVAGMFGLITMSMASPSSEATAAAAATPVQYEGLNGEGAWSMFQLQVPWENELASAPSFVNLNYTPRGSYFGREDLITSMTTAHTVNAPLVDFATAVGVFAVAAVVQRTPFGPVNPFAL